MVKVKTRTKDLLTVSQAAARLQTTRQGVHDAIKRRRLKAIKFGTVFLLDRVVVDAYGKSRKRTGRPRKKSK